MTKKRFHEVATLLVVVFALLNAVLALLLLSQKTYRSTVVGTYQTILLESSGQPIYLTFCKDGTYFHYTGKTLYESGAFGETDRAGVFQLTPEGQKESRQVVALEDGTLCFPENGDLRFYQLVAEIPTFVRDGDASRDYDNSQHPVDLQKSAS